MSKLLQKVLFFCTIIVASARKYQFHSTVAESSKGSKHSFADHRVNSSLARYSKVVFDTGKPAEKYATGGIVWSEQILGVRFLPVLPCSSAAIVDRTHSCRFAISSVQLYLDTERISLDSSNISLSLCEASSETYLPSSGCLSETFHLQNAPRVLAEWRPSESFELVHGGLYWLIVQGSALSPQCSFTWLDGEKTSADHLTSSAYKTSSESSWIFDARNHTLPSLNISVGENAKMSPTSLSIL
mmetsp:Transcript_10/g.15  ORF Transcript_10/g.15 Transcript_10/m.15 type:complete len:243 (+) Transcript_10:92-820(+)